MNKITEDLTYLLSDFKNNRLNFTETVLKINEIYARAIGAIPMSELYNLETDASTTGMQGEQR